MMLPLAAAVVLGVGAGGARQLPTVGVDFDFAPEFEFLLLDLDLPALEDEVASRAAEALGRNVGFLNFARGELVGSPFAYHLQVTLSGPHESARADADGGDEPAPPIFFENHFLLELWDVPREVRMRHPGEDEPVSYAIGYVKTDQIRNQVRFETLQGELAGTFLDHLASHRAEISSRLFSLIPICRRAHVFASSKPELTRVLLPFSFDDLFVAPDTLFTIEDFGENDDGSVAWEHRAVGAAKAIEDLWRRDPVRGREYFSALGAPATYWDRSLYPRPIVLDAPSPESNAPGVRELLDLRELPYADGEFHGSLEVWSIYVTDYRPSELGLKQLRRRGLDDLRELPPNPFELEE